jgi:quinol monooxygenase YgiN
MALYITAEYEVKPESVAKISKAIETFTTYVRENEPGTQMYFAWQKKDDPSKFTHFFIFEDERAKEIHSNSEAVKQFEAVYTPELLSRGVTFTNFNMIASNT